MAKKEIYPGKSEDSRDFENHYTAWRKVNAMFSELYEGIVNLRKEPSVNSQVDGKLTGGWYQVDGQIGIDSVYPPESEYDFPFFYGFDGDDNEVAGFIDPDGSIVKISTAKSFTDYGGNTLYEKYIPLVKPVDKVIFTLADRASPNVFVTEEIPVAFLTLGGGGWAHNLAGVWDRLEKKVAIGGVESTWYIHTRQAVSGVIFSLWDRIGGAATNENGLVKEIEVIYK